MFQHFRIYPQYFCMFTSTFQRASTRTHTYTHIYMGMQVLVGISIWVCRYAAMGIAFPYPYLAYLMVRVFSFITHGYLFFPNPYPNRVITRPFRGLSVPIVC